MKERTIGVNTLRELYHPTKVRLQGRMAYPLHTHTFGEIFWVDRGACLHRVNNQEFHLKTGDCVLIRPTDCHSLHSLPDQGEFWVVNIAFQWRLYQSIQLNYFSKDAMLYGEDRTVPLVFSLNKHQWKWVNEAFLGLIKRSRCAFYFDQFLMRMLEEAGNLPEKKTLLGDSAPAWLCQAWLRFQNPEHLRTGVRGFCRLCGRSPEHVSREFKRHTGQTVIQSINHLRLQQASALLSGTRMEIIDVALECGFENLSHFYKQFRGYFKSTPAAYRRHVQRDFYAV